METVAGTAHRLDIRRMRGVRLNLVADAVDMHSHRRAVAEGIESPDALEQGLAAENEAAVLHEELQKLKFAVGQMDFLAVFEYAVRLGLERQPAAGKLRDARLLFGCQLLVA